MLLVTILLGATIAPPVSTADAPFEWSAPVPVAAPGAFMSGITCTTRPLCVAVDHKGDVVQSLTSMAEPSSWLVQQPGGTELPLAAVSCTSQAFCVVIARNVEASILYSENASAPSPIWVREDKVDASGAPLSAISCVSASFCVAADEAGHILTSTDPAGGKWTGEPVDEAGRTRRPVPIYGLACITETFCVASDGAGRILTSKDPIAEKPSWQIRSVEANVTIWGVSCPSTALCAAVDGGGNVLTSTDPAAEVWVPDYRVDTHPLTGVSCVLPSTCVASDEAGNIVTSTAATSGAGAWSITGTGGGGRQITGVSCESSQHCVAIDDDGGVLIGTPAPLRTLSVQVEGTGSGTVTGAGISCPSVCSSGELNGASVVLTASSTAGSTFVGWSGACSGTGACDVAMNSDENVAANFAAKPSVVGPPPSGGGGHVAPGSTGVGSASTGTPTPTASAASVTVAGWIAALPTGVAMPLRCWAKTGTCPRTTLTLSIIESLRGKQVVAVAAGHGKLRKKRVVVGRTTVTLNAGQTATVDVTLNRAGRAQLNRLRRLSALLEISTRGGVTFWTQTVGLFQHKSRKHG